mmetsp:Transcript_27250/g.83663  ORF Transcript_27250/g.83663 Transcript_27250/m.83663 type:complete len:283 (+) Transcript_27250:675-1523(+)
MPGLQTSGRRITTDDPAIVLETSFVAPAPRMVLPKVMPVFETSVRSIVAAEPWLILELAFFADSTSCASVNSRGFADANLTPICGPSYSPRDLMWEPKAYIVCTTLPMSWPLYKSTVSKQSLSFTPKALTARTNEDTFSICMKGMDDLLIFFTLPGRILLTSSHNTTPLRSHSSNVPSHSRPVTASIHARTSSIAGRISSSFNRICSFTEASRAIFFPLVVGSVSVFSVGFVSSLERDELCTLWAINARLLLLLLLLCERWSGPRRQGRDGGRGLARRSDLP